MSAETKVDTQILQALSKLLKINQLEQMELETDAHLYKLPQFDFKVYNPCSNDTSQHQLF